MKKIPTLYCRDWDGDRRYVTREVNPECTWVFTDAGVIASRKYDGTCVMLDDDGRWWARREVKPRKDIPPNWLPVDHDPETGKTMGWEPIEQSSFAKFHAEALTWLTEMEPGTYELIGPKINGNPERAPHHDLVFHDATIINTDAPVPLDFDGLRAWLHAHPFEGIVWHGPDGRMAKLKARDFPAATKPASEATGEVAPDTTPTELRELDLDAPMARRFTTIDSITGLQLEGVLFSTGTAVVAHPIEGIGMTLDSEKELIHQFDVAWVDAADGNETDPERPRHGLTSLLKLLNDLVDRDDCWFDHNGGCQAHGYLHLSGGEQCPHQEAKEVLAALALDPTGGDR